MKRIRRDDKRALKLSASQWKLLADTDCLVPPCDKELQATSAAEPLLLTADELDNLARTIASEVSRTSDRAIARKLEVVLRKVQKLLSTHGSAESTLRQEPDRARSEVPLVGKPLQLAASAEKLLRAAEKLGIENSPLEHFWLSPAQREVLLAVPGMPKPISARLKKEQTSFTVTEVLRMTTMLTEGATESASWKQQARLLVARHLIERLREGVATEPEPAGQSGHKLRKGTKAKSTGKLYQFRIALTGLKPPVWRRIQITDCTLDKLHEYIQTSMGWTNSHLHDFLIDAQHYGDPMLVGQDLGEAGYQPSTRTRISDIVPETGARYRFTYQYDFGDCWEHEILFEGCPKKDAGQKYPLCLEGERACPPENLGGVPGYLKLLQVLGNPEHRSHAETLKSIGGSFAPEAFDPAAATERMIIGLPD